MYGGASAACLANYMDNWKCTGSLRGDGSPVNGAAGQAGTPGAAGTPGGPATQNALQAVAGRYV